MSRLSKTRRATRTLALALLLSAMISGCGLLPVEQDAPDLASDRSASEPAVSKPETATTEDSDTRSETHAATAPEVDTDARAEAETNSADTREPTQGLRIARSSSAESERRSSLQEQGYKTLDPGRLGYYMDVLGARLRQELAGQPAEINHQDAGIRVTLPDGDDQARSLETIGQLLDEFRANLVTVIAHGPNMHKVAAEPESMEDDALAAGRRLEGAGVAPERLVLRVFEAATPATNLDNGTLSPGIELLIQPLPSP